MPEQTADAAPHDHGHECAGDLEGGCAAGRADREGRDDRDRDRAWTVRLLGHDYALEVDASLKGNRIRVSRDGLGVHERLTHDDSPTITLPDGEKLDIRLSPLGALKRATIRNGDFDLDFDAPAGTKAARVQAWGRAHPHLFAARHVLTSGAGILLALIGIGWLIRLVEPYLPDFSLPSIPWPDLPSLDLPSIPWPDLPDIPWPQLPQFTAPAWLQAILETREYWLPIAVAMAIAVWEVRRQRRQRAHRERLRSGTRSGPAGAAAATEPAATVDAPPATDEPDGDESGDAARDEERSMGRRMDRQPE